MAGYRERVRAELTADIKASARRQMEVDGANQLSLRSIARELGMASSAIYRYFPSRDELLTALIVDAYNELGEVAERADANADAADRDPATRFTAVALAAYHWARRHPSQYSLLFGTPVPGYAAPDDTIGPATRFTLVLLRILDAASQLGSVPTVAPTVPASVEPDLHHLRALTGTTSNDTMLIAGLQVWTGLFGAISFVLFGQFKNVITDVDALFESIASVLARQVFDHRSFGA